MSASERAGSRLPEPFGHGARDWAAVGLGAAVVLWAASGGGLFFLVRALETLIRGPLVSGACLEEVAKLALFLALALARRWLRCRSGWLMPFFAVAGFGVAENLLYYLRYPTSSVYERLLYSYPIHLNTAVLFVLAFGSARQRPAAGRILVIGMALLVAIGYHYGLNVLSLLLPHPALYGVGLVNLGLFASLYWRQRTFAMQRSLRHAGS
jgi:RsiW-degrading membrane proteinase PrsW (M82 family)